MRENISYETLHMDMEKTHDEGGKVPYQPNRGMHHNDPLE